MSPLLLGEVLVVFVIRLTPDGKYPVHDCENLQLPIIIIHQILNIKKKGWFS